MAADYSAAVVQRDLESKRCQVHDTVFRQATWQHCMVLLACTPIQQIQGARRNDGASLGSRQQFWPQPRPRLFKIGYEADSDEDVTGQTGFEMGEAHSFDAILQERCVATLAEELPKLIYASKDGVVFGDLMQEMANRTTATAQLVKSSLDLSVKTGDLIVRREDGATRIKGSSIQDSDIILASPQRSLFFLAAAPKSTT